MKNLNIRIWEEDEYLSHGRAPAIGIRIEPKKTGGNLEVCLLLSARVQGHGVMSVTQYRPYTAILEATEGMADAALSMPIISGSAQAICDTGRTGRMVVRSHMPNARILSVPKEDAGQLVDILGEGDWIIQLKEKEEDN